MKKMLFLLKQNRAVCTIVILALCALFVFFHFRQSTKKKQAEISKPAISQSPRNNTPAPVQTQTMALFIPYWSLDNERPLALPAVGTTRSLPESLVYFGITPSINGIQKNDDGFRGLAQFHTLAQNYPHATTHLTVRMLSEEVAYDLFSSPHGQLKVFDEVVSVAKAYGFTGILLDLELSALPTDQLVHDISKFTQSFSSHVRSNGLSFNMTLFGDTLYRARPYNLADLTTFVDTFYIMAYDFHKARGSPGPNFPLYGSEVFGYDLSQMIGEITKTVGREKTLVVLGMYGYDWIVDEKKRPIKPAAAVTLSQVKEKFLQNCVWKNCVQMRHDQAAETEVSYVDEYLNYHIVWFEDEVSAEKKINFLKQQGISKIGIWAHGYY